MDCQGFNGHKLTKNHESSSNRIEVVRCAKCCKMFMPSGQITRSHINYHSTGDRQCEGLDLSLSEDNCPEFILEQVSQTHWTKGKLRCPKCQSIFGSFNFITNLKGQYGNSKMHAITLHRKKVDIIPRFTPGIQAKTVTCSVSLNKKLSHGISQSNSGGDTDKRNHIDIQCGTENLSEKPSQKSLLGISLVRTKHFIDGGNAAVLNCSYNNQPNQEEDGASTHTFHPFDIHSETNQTETNSYYVDLCGELNRDAPLLNYPFPDQHLSQNHVDETNTFDHHVARRGNLEPSRFTVMKSAPLNFGVVQCEKSKRLRRKWKYPFQDYFPQDFRYRDLVVDAEDCPNVEIGELNGGTRIRRRSERFQDLAVPKTPVDEVACLHDMTLNKRCGDAECIDVNSDMCAVCYEVMYRPHALQPCQHTFCMLCLWGLARHAPGSTTHCPLCRKLIEKCVPCAADAIKRQRPECDVATLSGTKFRTNST